MGKLKSFVKRVSWSIASAEAFVIVLLVGITGLVAFTFLVAVIVDPSGAPDGLDNMGIFILSWLSVAALGPWLAVAVSYIVGKYVRWLTDGDMGNDPTAWIFVTDEYDDRMCSPFEQTIAVWSVFILLVGGFILLTIYAPTLIVLTGAIMAVSWLFKFSYRLHKRLRNHVSDPNAHKTQ